MSIRRPSSAPVPTAQSGQDRLKAVLAVGIAQLQSVDTGTNLPQDKANPSKKSPSYSFGSGSSGPSGSGGNTSLLRRARVGPTDALRESQTENQRLSDSVRSLQLELTDCQSKGQRYREDLDELQRKVGSRMLRIRNLEEQLRSIKNNSSATARDQEKALQAVLLDIEQLTKERDDKEQERLQYATQITDLNTRVSGLEKEIGELNAETETLKDKLTTADKRFEDLADVVKPVSGELDPAVLTAFESARSAFEELESELPKWLAEAEDVVTSTRAVEESAAAASTENSRLLTQVTQLGEQTEEERNVITALVAQISAERDSRLAQARLADTENVSDAVEAEKVTMAATELKAAADVVAVAKQEYDAALETRKKASFESAKVVMMESFQEETSRLTAYYPDSVEYHLRSGGSDGQGGKLFTLSEEAKADLTKMAQLKSRMGGSAFNYLTANKEIAYQIEMQKKKVFDELVPAEIAVMNTRGLFEVATVEYDYAKVNLQSAEYYYANRKYLPELDDARAKVERARAQRTIEKDAKTGEKALNTADAARKQALDWQRKVQEKRDILEKLRYRIQVEKLSYEEINELKKKNNWNGRDGEPGYDFVRGQARASAQRFQEGAPGERYDKSKSWSLHDVRYGDVPYAKELKELVPQAEYDKKTAVDTMLLAEGVTEEKA